MLWIDNVEFFVIFFSTRCVSQRNCMHMRFSDATNRHSTFVVFYFVERFGRFWTETAYIVYISQMLVLVSGFLFSTAASSCWYGKRESEWTRCMHERINSETATMPHGSVIVNYFQQTGGVFERIDISMQLQYCCTCTQTNTRHTSCFIHVFDHWSIN